MNVLFLDIDGVLNSQHWFKSEQYMTARARFPAVVSADSTKKTASELHDCHIDPEPLELLKKCIQELELSVVLSSTWRTLPAGVEALERAGLSFIGMTPETPGTRSAEIQAWIDKSNGAAQFAILDDDDNMEHLRPNLVQTFYCSGFTEREARELRSRFKPMDPVGD